MIKTILIIFTFISSNCLVSNLRADSRQYGCKCGHLLGYANIVKADNEKDAVKKCEQYSSNCKAEDITGQPKSVPAETRTYYQQKNVLWSDKNAKGQFACGCADKGDTSGKYKYEGLLETNDENTALKKCQDIKCSKGKAFVKRVNTQYQCKCDGKEKSIIQLPDTEEAALKECQSTCKDKKAEIKLNKNHLQQVSLMTGIVT